MLNTRRSRWLRRVGLLLLALLAACSDRNEQASQGPVVVAADEAPTTPAPAAPVAARVQAMSAEQLAQAATEALRENRMYAPAGANALEYYLALRDKQPESAHVASAVTDLLPYTLIAAEQSLVRADLAEAQRLFGLLEKANPRFPALPRLRRDLAAAQEVATQRTRAAATPEPEGNPSDRPAPPPQAQRDTPPAATDPVPVPAQDTPPPQADTPAPVVAEPAAPPVQRPREQAAEAVSPPPDEANREVEPRPETAASAPARPAATRAPIVLRAVNTPSPRYPPEALRTGTGGTVVLEFTVGTNGAVSDVRVVRSDPARVFDREAINAARRWQFEPVEAPVTTRRTISFDPRQ